MIRQIVATSRPNFLILTPCCLSLVFAHAVADNIVVDSLHAALILIGALTAHISVNMFNEYLDFSSGLDMNTERTPFSGGSGTLPAVPALAISVYQIAIGSLLLTACIGIYFLVVAGLGLLPLGLAGLFLVYFYTQKITKWPWFCLIAPGLGFGPLMVCGGYYVLSGNITTPVFCSSLMVFFLVNNLLLLNQFPDVEADRDVGRCHLPILIGRKKSAWAYSGFMAAAYVTLSASVAAGLLPHYSLAGLLTGFLAIGAAVMAIRYAEDLAKLKPALALNVIITLTTPLLVAAGIFL